MDRRLLGQEGERIALSYLQGLRMNLLAQNYRCRLGELDLVMLDRGQVVIVEVRTKSSDSYGNGLESITEKKQAKLRTLAQVFLANTGRLGADIRFDVISVYKPSGGSVQLEHIKGAF